MWCPQCQADVAAELSPDNRRLRCTTCATELGTTDSPAPSAKLRDARELLERWSNTSVFDPYGPVVNRGIGGAGISLESTSRPETTPPRPAVPRPTAPAVVAATPSVAAATPVSEPTPAAPPSAQPVRRRKAGPPVRRVRMHQTQPSGVPVPHIESIPSRPPEPPRKRVNWINVLGQFCAYGGVAMLTCGSALVLWGYFGGPASYAPTGWLLTTVGQMLLFLGVVTLVSSGLEQTSEDVSRKVDSLGERLLNAEHLLRELATRRPLVVYDADGEAEQLEAA